MASVLLIDDDEFQRQLATLALQEAGHEILEASDGAAGIDSMRLFRPDVVVCDVVMPGMNGYQVAAAVRAEASLAATPIILLTSLSERAHMRLGMTSGADDFLNKPYRPRELVEAVDGVLKRRQAQQDAMASAIQDTFQKAMDQEQQQLAARYERQLVNELGARWQAQADAQGEIALPWALVVVADLFALIGEAAPEQARAELVRRTHQSGRDALFLFGATEVLNHGDELVGVFAEQGDRGAAASRAVRAAFALRTSTAAALSRGGGSLAVAVHAGPLTLLRMGDPLHGDAGTTPVPGATLRGAVALCELARRLGWGCAVSQDVLALLDPAQHDAGAAARLPEEPGLPDTARELRPPRPKA